MKRKDRKQNKCHNVYSYDLHIPNINDIYQDDKHPTCKLWKVINLIQPDLAMIQCIECAKTRRVTRFDLRGNFKHLPTYNKLPRYRLTSANIICLATMRKCSNHTVEDVIVHIPVSINGQPRFTNVDAWFCKQCQKFYMFHSTYDKIEGAPICSVIDLRTGMTIHKSSDYYISDGDSQTLLTYLGYSVNREKHLFKEQRHELLFDIINKKQMTKAEIISLLQFFIRRNYNNPYMSSAVDEWETDLEYVKTIEPCVAKYIDASSITLQ